MAAEKAPEQTLPDLAQLVLDSPPTTTSSTPAPPPPSDPTAAPTTRIIPDGPKISEPFQFGSRFLLSGDEVFSHNAWDHVETDAAYKAFSTSQFAAQRSKPADNYDKMRFNSDPRRWWDLFYKNNKENFFKDRKWLQQEFPILAAATEAAGVGAVSIVELGCGAGNTLFPVLAQNRNSGFHIHGADFSSNAIKIVKAQPLYCEMNPLGFVTASVYDLAAPDTLPTGVEPGSVDVVIMVFVFSALAPAQWSIALENVRRMLKPGGKVLFRDYGRGDLTQVRFKAGRYLEENFYVRGDGTRVYFFEQWELRKIFTGEAEKQKGELEKWGIREGQVGEKTQEGREEKEVEENQKGKEEEEESQEDKEERERQELKEEMERFPQGEFGGFIAKEMGVDRRLLVNRKLQLKMYRCWMQAVFEKL
ncbi:hypothetical protein Q9L58_000101 [Maublancomyces gigas]|uniref:tRNA N(3)-methylcytidine methyltransferase n=1 Tax=Discina gigas TaxID=1032678 RepID=A0ABR3GY45_9PEZI